MASGGGGGCVGPDGIDVGEGREVVRKSLGEARSGEMVEIDLKSVVDRFMDSHHRQVSARTTENEMSTAKKHKESSSNRAMKLNDLISFDNGGGASE